MLSLRFDLRSPPLGTPTAELYATALEMAEWAESVDALGVILSEHHASPDGYLPSPLLVASAMASRTTRLAIQVMALIATLHDPITMAEDMAVLDLLSGGRVSYVLGLGYRQVEFDLFGIERSERAQRLEHAVTIFRRAWSGQEIETASGPITVTPRPLSPEGPAIFLGGGSKAAVRRAARLGLGMLTERSDDLTQLYLDECAALGTEPGLFIEVPQDEITVAFVAEDVDAAWEQLAPHWMHDATMYSSWNQEAGKAGTASISSTTSIEQLRAAGHPYRVFDPAEAIEHLRGHGYMNLHPLCGGSPPELAWSSLRLLEEVVLPELRSSDPS